MKYDVAVIGGGASGMMAAGRAAALGAKVILIEQNRQLGTKLLITGGGRCNFTNRKSNRELANAFGKSGAWLLSGLSKFGPEETLKFFQDLGLKIKTEADDRVFPQSNLAQDVLAILIKYLKANHVKIKLGMAIKKIVPAQGLIDRVVMANGDEIIARQYILCTGGKSYPLTGSTGDGYIWLEKLGHHIITPTPALVPIILTEKLNLEGISLGEVLVNGKFLGPLLFTETGLSGPMILNLSQTLKAGDKLVINFLPQGYEMIQSKQAIKNTLSELLPARLVATILNLAQIDGLKKAITKSEKQRLDQLLTAFTVTVKALGGYDKAMVTAGGVDLKEVDPQTMRSKIIDNLSLAGEILNLTGQTGGYNLQLCWTSGYVAGDNINF